MKNIKKLISLILVVAFCITGVCGCGNIANQENATQSIVKNNLSKDGYKLEQVVVLSRHNIRSPLSDKGSVLDTMTPHDWIPWSSKASELSLRGGILETEMGQYFRKWLEKEGLFPENYMPRDGEVRIYANSKQRTISTANYFKTGLLPVSNLPVEYHMDYDNMDPVFNPQLTNINEQFKVEALQQMQEIYNSRMADLSDNYKLLGEVIDVEESEDYKSGKFTGFKPGDDTFTLEEMKEPALKGSLKTACSLSDALVLQYYEANPVNVAFGKHLSMKQWKDIAEIKDVYQDVLFSAPKIATNVANPLLKEIRAELDNNTRNFSFLCGHDSNISSVMSALSIENYNLPDAIEKTPIGCKLVFCKWVDSSGKEYISIDMLYQSLNQLKGMNLLDESNPPCIVELKFNGIEPNSNGLYAIEDAMGRFDKAISDYN